MALKASFFKYAQSKRLGCIACIQQSLRTSRSLEFCRHLSTAADSSSSQQNGATKIFCQHTFYKGKSALAINPGRPIFKTSEAGGVYLQKEGSLFMSFAPSTGPRQYDWCRKQFIALSATELGGLVALTTSDNLEFYHDPHMGSSDAGMVRKALKVEGMGDKSGFFFNMSVSNKLENVDERFSVPLTRGEFAVMRSSFNFIIPYLMGWHAHINPASIQTGEVNPELEWER
eukprot:c9368_g2_i1 orf=60-749(+)